MLSSEITFKQLLWRSGFTDLSQKGKHRIAKYLKVSKPTVDRWLKLNKPSKQAIELLEIKRVNLRQSVDWDGFVFRENYLVTPDGYRLDMPHLRHYGMYMHLLFAVLEDESYKQIPRVRHIEQHILKLVANGGFE